jgi:hypothetical protein
MTVDDRLREAHARIPDPDPATIARARGRLAAEDRPPKRRRRRVLTPLLPPALLAAAVAAVVALVPQRDDEVPVARPTAPATVDYQRNTFAISIRYIAADGRPTASPRAAAYGIARSVPEEIWRAPDGSGRIQYGAESAPYLPSPADERAWRAAGSPDLDELAGEPGRWGPKKTTYGPGELDDALLWNSNLEAVLPRRDPLSVLPHGWRELTAWLNDAAAKQRPGAPAHVVRDTLVDDALTFLRDARSPTALRVALIDVLRTLPSAQLLTQIRDAANRKWPGIELPGGLVVAYDQRTRRVMAKGARYADGVRWDLTYAVVSARVAAIGDRP